MVPRLFTVANVIAFLAAVISMRAPRAKATTTTYENWPYSLITRLAVRAMSGTARDSATLAAFSWQLGHESTSFQTALSILQAKVQFEQIVG